MPTPTPINPIPPISPVPFGTLYETGDFIDYGNGRGNGYYARAFKARDIRNGHEEVAFKVLRTEHMKHDNPGREYDSFGLEALLLAQMRPHPNVVKMTDCGFISHLAADPKRPAADRPDGGQIVSLGLDTEAFRRALPEFKGKGWRPYLCEKFQEPRNSMFLLLLEYNVGVHRRLPAVEGIELALQYADMLRTAHAANIVYLDAKLEHVYWDGAKLTVIDWNSSRLLGQAGGDDEDPSQLRKKDLRSFLVGILYPLLTGHPATGRAFEEMPSDRKRVLERYEAIRDLDFDTEPDLPKCLVDIIQAGVHWKFSMIQELLAELNRCAQQCGRPVGNAPGAAPASKAWNHTARGVKRLRRAQTELETARKDFMEALTEDDSSLEVKRLIRLTNEFLQKRVIP